MIKAKKSLGQNFLIDQNIIKKIVKTVFVKNNNIFEIGAGTGNLSKEILYNQPKSLTLVEKDKGLFNKLDENFKSNSSIKLIHDDILDLEINKHLKSNAIIFGNLPYNISTQILVKLINIKWPPNFKKLVLMFQKEVAERLLAKCKSNKYGRLRIISNWRLKVTDHFDISKNCFYPKPKIDSTVLVFEPIIHKSFKISDIKNLEKITHLFFSKRRKMINKVFANLFDDSVVHAKKLNIDLSMRPNQLSENEYYKIVEYYEKINNL